MKSKIVPLIAAFVIFIAFYKLCMSHFVGITPSGVREQYFGSDGICGVAALLAASVLYWSLVRFINRPARPARLITSFWAATLLFAIATFINLPDPRCGDCVLSYGFPFSYYKEGGFAWRAYYVPLGIIGDVLVVSATALLIYWVWNRFKPT